MISAGEMTGLGILSAWEPCGGILCANLPVVYRYIIQIASQLRATIVNSSNRGEAKTHSSRLGSQRIVQHDWVRLPVEGMGLSAVALHDRYSQKGLPEPESVELERASWGGIKVQQSIHQHREW